LRTQISGSPRNSAFSVAGVLVSSAIDSVRLKLFEFGMSK
jgi:hypothetical protein